MKWFIFLAFMLALISCSDGENPEFDNNLVDDSVNDADTGEILNSYTYEKSSTDLEKGIIKSSVACGENIYFSREYEGKAFISKYTSLEMSWKIELSNSQSQSVNALSCGKNGNFFAAGDRTATENSNLVGFITEFDENGTILIDFELNNDVSVSIYSIFVDDSENIFICGRVDGSFEGTESVGDKDGFIGKFSKTGEKIFLVQVGTKVFDSIQSVAVGSDNFVIAAGYTAGDLKTGDENPEKKITGFLVKLKADGELHWTKTTDLSHAWDIATDLDNFFFVAGSKEVDEKEVATVLRYDLGGTVKCRFSFPSKGDSIATDVAFDKNMDLYIAGYFTGEFESGSAIDLDDTKEGTDIFLGIFNPLNAENLFSGIYGTESNDINPRIAIDSSLNPHLLYNTVEELTSNDANATLVTLKKQPIE